MRRSGDKPVDVIVHEKNKTEARKQFVRQYAMLENLLETCLPTAVLIASRSCRTPPPVEVGQEAGKQSDRRQERAKLIHKIDPGMVRQLAQKRRADAA